MSKKFAEDAMLRLIGMAEKVEAGQADQAAMSRSFDSRIGDRMVRVDVKVEVR